MTPKYKFRQQSAGVLHSFTKFCEKNPQMRFYKAMSVWLGKDVKVGGVDTYYWKAKNK